MLKELRESAGLTQQELAFRTGLSASSIFKIESGSQKMTLPTAKKISDALASVLPRSSSTLLSELAGID